MTRSSEQSFYSRKFLHRKINWHHWQKDKTLNIRFWDAIDRKFEFVAKFLRKIFPKKNKKPKLIRRWEGIREGVDEKIVKFEVKSKKSKHPKRLLEGNCLIIVSIQMKDLRELFLFFFFENISYILLYNIKSVPEDKPIVSSCDKCDEKSLLKKNCINYNNITFVKYKTLKIIFISTFVSIFETFKSNLIKFIFYI